MTQSLFHRSQAMGTAQTKLNLIDKHDFALQILFHGINTRNLVKTVEIDSTIKILRTFLKGRVWQHCDSCYFSYFIVFPHVHQSLRKKCPCSHFFWSVFSRVRIENLSILTLNARKYGVEKLRIRTLFTQCRLSLLSEVYPVDVPYILGNSVFLYLCNYLISINEISPQRLFDIESFQV